MCLRMVEIGEDGGLLVETLRRGQHPLPREDLLQVVEGLDARLEGPPEGQSLLIMGLSLAVCTEGLSHLAQIA